VISWTLPTNAGEASTIMVALLFGMTLPITPIQILWVNMITAVTLGIALAFEPTEDNTMRRPPRRATSRC
jgi:magnesium-transporting ATPase (P-type)